MPSVFTAHAKQRWIERVEDWSDIAIELASYSVKLKKTQRTTLRAMMPAWKDEIGKHRANYRYNKGIVFVCSQENNVRHVITVFRAQSPMGFAYNPFLNR